MNVNELLDTIEDALEESANVPLSGGKRIVDVEQIRDYLDEIRANLPGELRQAQQIVNDRSQIVETANAQAQVIGQRLGNQTALAAGGVVVPLDQGQLALLKGQQVRRPVRGLHRQGVGRDLIGLGHLLDTRGAVQLGRRAVGLGDVQHIGDADVYPAQLILPHGQLHV